MENIMLIDERELLGKQFRIFGTVEEPLFLAKDVAEWIDYSKSNGKYKVSQMLNTVDEDEKLVSDIYYSGQNRKMWFVSKKGVKQILANSRKRIAKELLEQIDDSYALKKTPKQTEFEAMLKNAIEAHLNQPDLDFRLCPFNDKDDYFLHYKDSLSYEAEKQFGKYRVDFYFPKFNLVVEYDEKHHISQSCEDAERESYLHKYINEEIGNSTWEFDGSLVRIIRVKEGEEFAGIIKIITTLMYIAFAR